jgi:hypothetical protein
MSEFLIIDGITYQVPIIELKRKADILDKYAYRSEDGILHREVIGTYYNYSMKIGTVNDPVLYERLFSVLSAPVAYHTVELPNDHVAFKGYFSSISDEVSRVRSDGTKYKELSCNLTARAPRRRPGETENYGLQPGGV